MTVKGKNFGEVGDFVSAFAGNKIRVIVEKQRKQYVRTQAQGSSLFLKTFFVVSS
jgi:hypothetical protein